MIFKKLLAVCTALTILVGTSAFTRSSPGEGSVTAYAGIKTASDTMSSLSDEMTKLIKAHKYTSAVIVYSMDGETLYSYQPNTFIFGASLIKLPYVYYCCTQLSKGVRSLDETITYTQSWYHGGSGIIAYSGTGKKYTIAQLIDYALRYSDNVAYDMLVYLFGINGFNNMVDSWGYNIHIASQMYFPNLTASFMKTSMQKMQEKSDAGECWRIAWTALNESTESYAREAIGGDNEIAVKYGNVSAQWHETCYVSGDTPYIFVILSGATNLAADVGFVTGAAKCADKMAKAHYEAVAATATTTTTTTITTTTTTADNNNGSDSIDYELGDVNNDKIVDAVDASKVLEEYAGLSSETGRTFSDAQFMAADVNFDGLIDSVDASCILAYYAYTSVTEDEPMTIKEFLNQEEAE